MLFHCWRISNCKYTGIFSGSGERRSLPLPDWFATAALSLSWWEYRKLDGRCSGWGMHECRSTSINTVAISSLCSDYTRRIRFRHGKGTTCGASYKWQIPARCSLPLSLSHPTRLTYICTYSVTWICSGFWVGFGFSNVANTHSITERGSERWSWRWTVETKALPCLASCLLPALLPYGCCGTLSAC